MGIRNCIVCFEPALCEDTDNAENIECTGTDDGVKDEKLLPPITLLRTLFNIPLEMCMQFLKDYENPNSWIFWCNTCYSTLIKKVETAYLQIQFLEKQMNLFRMDVKNAIVKSAVRGTPIVDPRQQKMHKFSPSPAESIRSYVVREHYHAITKSRGAVKRNAHTEVKTQASSEVIFPSRISKSSEESKISSSPEESNCELRIVALKSLQTSQPTKNSSPDEVECIDLESDDENDEPKEWDNKKKNSFNLKGPSSADKVYLETNKESEVEILPIFEISDEQCSSSNSYGADTALSHGSADEISSEEMAEFVQMFRRRRTALGFNQERVGQSLGLIYGDIFSQTTISRFEKLQLSFTNMCKLKPVLQRWIDEAEGNTNSSTSRTTNIPGGALGGSCYKRRKRTVIYGSVKGELENYFLKQRSPNSEDIANIAESLGLERETIRIWFCNRRQKEKRLNVQREEEIDEWMDQSSSLSSSARQTQPNSDVSLHVTETPTAAYPSKTFSQPNSEIICQLKSTDNDNCQNSEMFDGNEYILP